MQVKDILVVLNPRAKAVGSYAISSATLTRAEVTAATLAVDPIMPSYIVAEVPTDFLEAVRGDARQAAQKSLDAFVEEARTAGVAVRPRVFEGSLDGVARDLAASARYHDLVVLEQSDPDSPGGQTILIETMLFGAGRPVLIVPYIQRAPMRLDKVVVAWDGSLTATRAVAAAMPLIGAAREVEVLAIDEAGPSDMDAKVSRLAEHLARHGIRATSERLTDIGGIAETMLSHLADVGADLFVMGAYGHTRMREYILGGATRGILESMTVPVVMAH